jgi:putative ABC transport system substrate-binding protein
MRRHGMRRLIPLLLGFLVVPLATEAQQAGKVVRIGRLAPISASIDGRVLEGFRQALQDRGWVEGQNLAFEYRYADGQLERLPALAAELVRLKVDVILAGSTPGALAAKHATSTIPIVMATTGDPVGGGLVPSLARPGGNLTGVTALGEAVIGKRLELLTEAVPGVTRVAVLTDPASPYSGPFRHEVERAARALGVELHVLEGRDPGEFEPAFAAMRSEGAQALMMGMDPIFATHRRRIVELAAQSQLPTMYGLWEFVEVGGLMFYGESLPHMYRRAATFVDKILKGVKPADLPVEQATTFEFVINLKTAQALGLTLPPMFLFQADEVIR